MQTAPRPGAVRHWQPRCDGATLPAWAAPLRFVPVGIAGTYPVVFARAVQIAIVLLVEAALVFGAAGRLDWAWAWVFLAIYLASTPSALDRSGCAQRSRSTRS